MKERIFLEIIQTITELEFKYDKILIQSEFRILAKKTKWEAIEYLYKKKESLLKSIEQKHSERMFKRLEITNIFINLINNMTAKEYILFKKEIQNRNTQLESPVITRICKTGI